jgi:hypothetical protein
MDYNSYRSFYFDIQYSTFDIRHFFTFSFLIFHLSFFISLSLLRLLRPRILQRHCSVKHHFLFKSIFI